jgi:hypothetical protein
VELGEKRLRNSNFLPHAQSVYLTADCQINAIRAYLAAFGIVASVGRKEVEEALGVFVDPGNMRLPNVTRACRTGRSNAATHGPDPAVRTYDNDAALIQQLPVHCQHESCANLRSQNL